MFALPAMPAIADIQSEDFRFPEAGNTIFIDGTRGAPLHVEYVGPHLTTPLKVKVTPDDPRLKLTPSICTFSALVKTCRPEIHLANSKNKVYGVHTFTVTEAGGAAPAPGSVATATPVTFGLGVTESDMPAAIPWKPHSGPVSRPVILVNATQQHRVYRGLLELNPDKENDHTVYTDYISLPAQSVCYLDLYSAPYSGYLRFNLSTNWESWSFRGNGNYFEDITDSSDPIYNGPYGTGANNISTCSGDSKTSCASGKWGSWSVGVANISGSDAVDSGYKIKAGEIQLIEDTSWGNASLFNGGTMIFWREGFAGNGMALLLIEGSTDGSGFNVRSAAPNLEEIKAAPPCSNYTI
jgi:hypothetical protein